MANTVTMRDNGIIEVAVIGDQNATSVETMGTDVKRHLTACRDAGRPCLILDDITHLGSTDIPARQAVARLAKTLPFDRVAMLGDGSVLMRVGTNLLLKAIGMGNKMSYFEDRDKATEWLLRG